MFEIISADNKLSGTIAHKQMVPEVVQALIMVLTKGNQNVAPCCVSYDGVNITIHSPNSDHWNNRLHQVLMFANWSNRFGYPNHARFIMGLTRLMNDIGELKFSDVKIGTRTARTVYMSNEEWAAYESVGKHKWLRGHLAHFIRKE